MPGINRNRSVWQNLDWITFGLYVGILLFGWLIVYAVQYNPNGSALIGFEGIHGRQLLWIVISLVIGFTLLIFEAEFFPSFAWIIYGVVFLLLVAVLFFAREVNGAKSWLEIGSIKIQPSEFAKYA
ncbi:MAG: rod shape determining protein RodA, partial [Limisphaerales bacterium]